MIPAATGKRGPGRQAALYPMAALPCPSPWSFPRDKEPHDPADDGYPQDDAHDHGKDNGKSKGQLEDHVKEGEQEYAEEDRQAAGSKVFRFQHDGSTPFPRSDETTRRDMSLRCSDALNPEGLFLL